MTPDPHRRPSRGGPLTRLSRWARHTPDSEIAMTAVALGMLLIGVAAVLYATL